MYCVSTDVSIFMVLKCRLNWLVVISLVLSVNCSWTLNTDITVFGHYITPLQTVHQLVMETRDTDTDYHLALDYVNCKRCKIDSCVVSVLWKVGIHAWPSQAKYAVFHKSEWMRENCWVVLNILSLNERNKISDLMLFIVVLELKHSSSEIGSEKVF